MRSFRSLLADLISAPALVLAGVAAAVSVAAQGGRVSLLLDIIAQFALVLFAAGLCVLAAAFLVHRWARKPLIVLGLVTIVSSGALIAPELLRDTGPKAAPDTPGQIKIIQFNALETNSELKLVVDWLVKQDPDIVTIQEARHDLRDAITARTGWHVFGGFGNLMIFSRSPWLELNRPILPTASRLHWVNATYPSPSGPYEVVTVHLDWPLGPSQKGQWAGLVELMRRLPTNRTIITGDFNATPFSFVLRGAETRLPLPRRDRALPSFPAKWKADGPVRSPLPILPIDHVYAGGGWATVKVERGPSGLGSDHYPLILTLAPVNPAPVAQR